MADRAPLDAKRTDAGINRRIELMILTRAQSRTVAAMFGTPGATQLLTEGVSVSAPAQAGKSGRRPGWRRRGAARPTGEITMTIQSKTRGNRMKITGTGAPTMTPAIGGATAAPRPPHRRNRKRRAPESSVLQPAAKALAALPDFDAARVAELRDALAKGELPFDAGRLAGLIQRFHGGRG
jgi:negative regulator of flagellin synthesis FlgM